MLLYTNGTTEATEAQIRTALQEKVRGDVSAWLTTNCPKLATVVSAGSITVSPETSTAKIGDWLWLSFDLAGSTGDRKRLLAMSMKTLLSWGDGMGSLVDGEVNTVRCTKAVAQGWAQWVESVL